MEKRLTEQLKRAIIENNEFSASMLLTRLKNLGVNLDELLEEFNTKQIMEG